MRNTQTSAMAIKGHQYATQRGRRTTTGDTLSGKALPNKALSDKALLGTATYAILLPPTTHSTGGGSMAQAGINVGPFDARARQVAGALAIIGGLTALNGFFQALGFLTWIVCAAMMYVGILFALGGFKDGTAQFGHPLLSLSVLDAWLPLVHKGYWGLIAGLFVAIGALQTARTRVCPINGLLGVNTAAASSA